MPRPVKPPSRATRPPRAGFRFHSALPALLVLGVASAAEAGPWTRPRDASFSKFTASYMYTRTEFDTDGEEVPVLTSNPLVEAAAYREVVLSSYVEYGWRDGLTLIGSLPFKIATSTRTETSEDASIRREVDVTNAGFSDLYAAGRAALARGRFPISAEAGVSVPLGYDSTPDNGGPALGSGHPDGVLALSAGTAGASAYAAARASYRLRGGDLDNEVGFGVEAGARAGRAFGQALLEGSYTTGEITPLTVSSTSAAVNQEVLKLIVTAGIRTAKNTALATEIYHVLDGRNTAAGTTFAVSLVLER